MSIWDDVLDAYASLKIASKGMVDMEVGETLEIDTPDIDLTVRVKGKTFRGHVVSVNVERDS